MHKFPTLAYLAAAALAIVTIVGANLTQTATTGNIALAQAMFAGDFPMVQQLPADGQVAHHEANGEPANLN